MIKESDNKLFSQIIGIIITTNKKYPKYNPNNNINIALSTLLNFTILLSSCSINSIRTNSMIYYYYYLYILLYKGQLANK